MIILIKLFQRIAKSHASLNSDVKVHIPLNISPHEDICGLKEKSQFFLAMDTCHHPLSRILYENPPNLGV